MVEWVSNYSLADNEGLDTADFASVHDSYTSVHSALLAFGACMSVCVCVNVQ
jgi:hypothetical protein